MGTPTVLAPNHAAYALIPPLRSSCPSDAFSAVLLLDCAGKHSTKGNSSGLCGRFLLQRFGAYSIVRGTADRNAFRTTRELLCERQLAASLSSLRAKFHGKMIPFMRFERGTIQLCFWALDDMAKNWRLDKPLYVVPIGIKYHYPQDMWNDIDAALTRIRGKNSSAC